MTHNSEISTREVSNKFSWQRAWAISSLYQPAIKWQIIIYVAVSLFTGVVTYALNASMLGILSMGLFGTVTGFMTYFGSLVFARKSNLVIETTLPATNAEKCAFYVLYSVIVIPALINLPYYAVMLIGNAIHPVADSLKEIMELQSDMLAKTYGLSTLSALLPISVCLYTLMASEKNRIVKAVLWTVGVNVVLALAGAVYGIVMALSNAFPDPTNAQNAYQFGLQFGGSLKDMVIITSIFSGTVALVMLWLTCRKISHRQL